MDLGYTGVRYTRSNLQTLSSRVQTRIDREVGNKSSLKVFPKVVVRHLSRGSSDHCAILIDTNPLSWNAGGKKSFSY